ncbi:unnamed protein product [Protopolystoma xenopodis]|uniref:Uncharacterized protein n=1 Tax=Protopolystoma xenopodis TaxID=117903 RepID=A0A3S5AHE9_9PLAT|nr:unnamed protein product [Protopolystoma xenopodis]
MPLQAYSASTCPTNFTVNVAVGPEHRRALGKLINGRLVPELYHPLGLLRYYDPGATFGDATCGPGSGGVGEPGGLRNGALRSQNAAVSGSGTGSAPGADAVSEATRRRRRKRGCITVWPGNLALRRWLNTRRVGLLIPKAKLRMKLFCEQFTSMSFPMGRAMVSWSRRQRT